MQFWQCSISLQFLQIITAKNFAFGSLQNLQLLSSANCSVSLHAMVHCNSKCIAVIPLQFHCNFPAIVCSVGLKGLMPFSIYSKVKFNIFPSHEPKQKNPGLPKISGTLTITKSAWNFCKSRIFPAPEKGKCWILQC